MSSNDKSPENIRPSVPIPIASRHARGRSMSVSSASSGSLSSGSELATPASGSIGSQRITIPSPSTSPILSYFLAQSPTTKAPSTGTFPFKRTFGPSPVLEEETEQVIPAAVHARRASATFSNRFTHNPPISTALPEAQTERGTNLLRRLSLSSSAFVKPQLDSGPRSASPPSPPPNSAVSPTMKTAPFQTKPRRSATISSDGTKPRRAPSPMGERILKGHFDGFN